MQSPWLGQKLTEGPHLPLVSTTHFNLHWHSVTNRKLHFPWCFSMFTTWLNSLMTHHVTIVLCLAVSHRGSLQRDPSVIWLWPGALRRAPRSRRFSVLFRISYLLSSAPFKNAEQPRHPVVWLSGVHAVGNVPGSTFANMTDMLTVSLISQCCSVLCCFYNQFNLDSRSHFEQIRVYKLIPGQVNLFRSTHLLSHNTIT